jgi:hypothetical protein
VVGPGFSSDLAQVWQVPGRSLHSYTPARQPFLRLDNMKTMRTTGKQQAIRNAFWRHGLHTTPKVVVHALRELGIFVDETLVRQVQFEMLKEITEPRAGKLSRPVPLRAVRRRPRSFPGRQGRG